MEPTKQQNFVKRFAIFIFILEILFFAYNILRSIGSWGTWEPGLWPSYTFVCLSLLEIVSLGFLFFKKYIKPTIVVFIGLFISIYLGYISVIKITQHYIDIARVQSLQKNGYAALMIKLNNDFSTPKKIKSVMLDRQAGHDQYILLENDLRVYPVDMPEYSNVFTPLTDDQIIKIKTLLNNKVVQLKVDTDIKDYPGYDISSIYIENNHPIPAHIYVDDKLLDSSFIYK